MARGSVRTHTRRTASGGTSTVTQHSRTGRGRKPLISPGHAWRLFKKALRAGKRKRRGLAIALGCAATAELGAWLTLRGAGLMLTTAAVVAFSVAAVMMTATGAE